MEEKIENNKAITEYNDKEIHYIKTPIGKTLYLKKPTEKKQKEKCKPSDRLKCDICGKEFFRSGRSNHNKTQFHKTHELVNKKIREFLIK